MFLSECFDLTINLETAIHIVHTSDRFEMKSIDIQIFYFLTFSFDAGDPEIFQGPKKTSPDFRWRLEPSVCLFRRGGLFL